MAASGCMGDRLVLRMGQSQVCDRSCSTSPPTSSELRPGPQLSVCVCVCVCACVCSVYLGYHGRHPEMASVAELGCRRCSMQHAAMQHDARAQSQHAHIIR
jgi:hypothetical protein